MKVTNTIRRASAVLTVAIAMLAVTGPANAAGTGLPVTLSGVADSQALRVQLTLPGVDALKAALLDAGVPVGSLPNTGLGGITIDEKISLNHGEVAHNLQGVQNRASGFATAITGVLPVAGSLTQSVSSSCIGTSSNCTGGTPVALINQDLPADLGHLKVAGAESVTSDLLNTRNVTGLVDAKVDIASLIGQGAPLAQVGELLNTLTSTINTEVLPPVNDALGDLEKTLETTLENASPEVKAQLDKLVTLGTIEDLPDLRTVSLAELTVLGAKADVVSKTINGVKGLNAISSSSVADVNILGGWASIEAVKILADSFANGVKGAAKSDATSSIVGAKLGGLLGADIDGADIDAIIHPDNLKAAIRAAAEKYDLDANKAEDLVHALELVTNIAGIEAKFFGTTENVDPAGKFADATAGTLALIVEPKVPVLDTMFTLPGQTVPQFKEYVSTGVRLRIDLPNASSAVSVAANVLNRRFPAPKGRTGVGTPFLVAFVLLGLAAGIRKFATSK
jgi:hypothetical protein